MEKMLKRTVGQDSAQGMSRRAFMGAAAAAAVAGCCGAKQGMAHGVATVDQTAAADQAAAPVVSDLTGWAGTPKVVADLGGSTMPLADLNRYRQQYVDAQTDYTCADGTVIPAVFVKVRALVHTYGMGNGNTLDDTVWDGILRDFSEDDAQMFLDMPWGVDFSVIDLAAKTGRTQDDCAEVCNRLADKGWLCRASRNTGTVFHQVPWFQGVVEYHFKDYADGLPLGVVGSDMFLTDASGVKDFRDGGTPTFYALPVGKSVTADNTVLPYDDYEQIIASNNRFAIAPCYCRYSAIRLSGLECPSFEDFATGEFEDYFSPIHNQRVETCLMMGDEAEYWIGLDIAREITREKALEYVQRSVDDGFILQCSFGKDSETICSCHADSCGICMEWSCVGTPDEIGSCQSRQQISHYLLEFDADSCIKCGACAQRCPLHAIAMDGVDGTPKVNAMCIRCGQCAYICPQQARRLSQRPDEMNLPLPEGFVDDNNMKAAYRFEHGLIR